MTECAFVGALLCHSSDNMRVISNIAEDIKVGMLCRYIIRLLIYSSHSANSFSCCGLQAEFGLKVWGQS